jgi:hypothetical protein
MNSIKKIMLHHKKLETLQALIRSVCCLCENGILYKYQVTLIFFFLIIFAFKIEGRQN